jgi:hypothetical protein
MKCVHCTLDNNNYRFCEGCGRPLVFVKKEKCKELPDYSTKFLDEAVRAVESIFCAQGVQTANIDINSTALNLHEIAKDNGILIIDNMQWEKMKNESKKKVFFNDNLLCILFCTIFVTGSMAVSSFSFLSLIKFWISGYIFISFFLWVIFPFLTGATVSTLSLFRAGLFSDNKSLKGNLSSLIILFIFIQLYIFPPILLIEYIAFIKNPGYVPFIIRISGIDFLMRTGGDY